MGNVDLDLAPDQIERELAELTEEDEGGKKERAKKKPKTKFVTLTKAEIEKLSERGRMEYKIELSKYKTKQLEKNYQKYKSKETETNLSSKTKKLIILGRFLQTQFANDDRRVQYLVVQSHLDQYLTQDIDRQLLGFPPLGQPIDQDPQLINQSNLA